MPAGCQRRPHLRVRERVRAKRILATSFFLAESFQSTKARRRELFARKGNTLLTSIWEKRKIKQQSFADDIFMISTARQRFVTAACLTARRKIAIWTAFSFWDGKKERGKIFTFPLYYGFVLEFWWLVFRDKTVAFHSWVGKFDLNLAEISLIEREIYK